jgi:hypothetical protein
VYHPRLSNHLHQWFTVWDPSLLKTRLLLVPFQNSHPHETASKITFEDSSLLVCDALPLDQKFLTDPTTRRHIPEDLNLQQHRCYNLKSRKFVMLYDLENQLFWCSRLVCQAGRRQVLSPLVTKTRQPESNFLASLSRFKNFTLFNALFCLCFIRRLRQ